MVGQVVVGLDPGEVEGCAVGVFGGLLGAVVRCWGRRCTRAHGAVGRGDDEKGAHEGEAACFRATDDTATWRGASWR